MMLAWLSSSENHRILSPQQGLEQAPVGVEARGVKDRIIGAQKGADLVLQLLVQGLGTTDKAHRGHPVAPVFQPPGRGGVYLGVLGQAQVVVGAEVEHLAVTLYPHVGPLGGGDGTF